MIVGAIFLFALYLSKLHLQQSSQMVIITSMEVGMGFTIVFIILMVGCNQWPIRLSTCFDALPEEELLLNHLCLKWKISTKLSKLEKMTQIKNKLDSVLAAKVEIDKRAQELASKQQDDPLVYRKLIEDPNWHKMQTLLDEMLNHDCKHSYYKLEQEILLIKDTEVPANAASSEHQQFVPNKVQAHP